MMAVVICLSSLSSLSNPLSSAVRGWVGRTRLYGYPFAVRTFPRCLIAFLSDSSFVETFSALLTRKRTTRGPSGGGTLRGGT